MENYHIQIFFSGSSKSKNQKSTKTFNKTYFYKVILSYLFSRFEIIKQFGLVNNLSFKLI